MIFDFTNTELELIYKLTKIDASKNINKEQTHIIFKAVEHEYIFNGFDKNDFPTKNGLICVDILDIIADKKTKKST